MMWKPVTDEGRRSGVAKWNYDSKLENGLPLTIGDTVCILEENESGWYRGYHTKKPDMKGIFPASMVHIHEVPAGEEARRRKSNEPLIQEVTLVLREWHVLFYERFMKHKMDWFRELKKIMLELIELRHQLLAGTMPLGKMKEVKCTIMSRVDWGNCRLGLDLVPSVDGEIVSSNQCSLVELHKVHQRSEQDTRNSSLPVATSVQPLLSLISIQVPETTAQQSTEPLEAYAHHLHLQLVNFGINTGEAAEAFFALYDAKESSFITERYLAKFNRQGAPLNVEKIGNIVTIFTDLSNKDLNRDLYLTCHIIRRGQMQHGKNQKNTGISFRRPYGYGVLKLQHILAKNMAEDDGREGKEEVMKIYCVSGQDVEKDFASLHDQLIKNTGKKGGNPQASPGITVKVLMLHGHMETLKKEKHLLFNRGHSITRKLGFSDIIMPGDLRNDLFISLEKAELSDKNGGRNIEAAMCVIDDKWDKLACICMVDDEPPEEEYRSVVYHRNQAPRWNEIVRLNVPMDIFKDTHIRFEFRHASKDAKKREKRLFAIAFMPLMKKDGTAVEDGTHSLFVYKCTEHHDFRNADQYLKLPYCSSDMVAKGNATSNDHFILNHRDSFEVRTVICSTKLTQNIHLLGLLKWRAQPGKLRATLEKLTSVKGQDIVRILQDILDALFSILDERTEEYGRQIFECLVHIISVLGEQRFKSFTTVLDTYIEKHFVSTLAHQFLVHYLMMYIDKALQQKEEHITNMLEGLQYLFKFIFRSHILYKMATGDIHDGDMQDSIRNLFQSINSLMMKDDEGLEKHQLVVLRKFSSICNELMAMSMYTAPEVSQFTADLLSCIPLNLPKTKNSVLQSKLECIKEAINSSLFKNPMARRVLLQPCLTQLHHHVCSEDLPDLCISIVEDILTTLYTLSQTESVDEEIGLVIRSLFREVLGTVPTSENMQEIHTRCITCLMEMLRLMKDQHYVQLMNNFSMPTQRQDFLTGILMLFTECVTKDIYSKDWAAMRMVANRVILDAIKRFCSDLNHEDMMKMRPAYFKLLVNFITQPALQLETFTLAKQERLKQKFGDMRIEMTTEMIGKWNSLGAARCEFSNLIRPFLEVTLIPHEDIRRASLPLIFDIMCCAMQEENSFMKLEDDLIDKLDEMVCVQYKGDEQYTQLFNSILSEKIAMQPWQEEGLQFVEKVTRLLERLIDYRNVSNKSVENRYLKLSCMYQLMNFYKDDERRKDIYMRYIYRLHDDHLRVGDFTEAAHTLLMLASTLEWSDVWMAADGKHPPQSARDRKAKLYGEIIELVKKGQVWEYGIPLCKELAIQYETKLFDYKNLSVQLATQAQFFENIRNQPRQPPTFFRIRFFGTFPVLRKHREYIYRGKPFDQNQVVLQRFQADFPQAKAWTNKLPPTEEELANNEQYIEVRQVTKVPPPHPHLETQNVPPNIRHFAENYNISVFSFDRPFHRGERDKQQEFKSLWVERTVLTTASPLPGLLGWSEIIKTEQHEIRPIANAINTMSDKNTSMRNQIEEHRAHRNFNINPLSMVLQGTIEAAVMGGAKVYQEIFLTPEYEENNPNDKEAIVSLKKLMVEQLMILDDGVLLHKELCSDELQNFHLNLEKKLSKLMVEFGLGQPKVYSRARPSRGSTIAPSPAAGIQSGARTFKKMPSDSNLPQQHHPKDRTTSRFYCQTPESIPSRNRSQSVFTLETSSQKKAIRKDSLPTLLSPISNTAIQEFVTDVADTPYSSSSSSNRTSESPSLMSSSSISRLSQDSQASSIPEDPLRPSLPPRKGTRPDSTGSGMSSSSSCSDTHHSSGTEMTEDAPPVPQRTQITPKDNLLHGTSGTGSSGLLYNPPSPSQAPPQVHPPQNLHQSSVSNYTNLSNSSSNITTSPGSVPHSTPPRRHPGPGSTPPPTLPKSTRRPTNLTSPVPHTNKANGFSSDQSSPGSTPYNPPIPVRPAKSQHRTSGPPPSPMASPASPQTMASHSRGGTPSPPMAASPKNGELFQVDAPPVPERPEKRRKPSKTFEPAPTNGGGGTNL